MIVFVHSPGFVGLYYPWLDPLPLVHGVSFFFVLSGFILAYVYPTLSWRDAPRFWWARIARIWPAHAATFLMVIVLFANLGLPPGDSITTAIPNLLLVHAWIPIDAFFFSFNAPSWSVSTELGFYLLFPVLVHNFRRTWAWKLGASLLLLAMMIVLGNRVSGYALSPIYAINMHGLVYIHPLSRLFEFVLGMCTWLLWTRIHGSVRLGQLWCTIGEVAALGLIAALMYASALGAPVWTEKLGPGGADWFATGGGSALGFAALILVVALNRGLGARLLCMPALVLLGEISYSIYLVHHILIRELHGRAWLQGLPPEVRFPVLWLLVIITSFIIWRFVERPARSLLRRLPTRAITARSAIRLWRREAAQSPPLRSLAVATLGVVACATAAILIRLNSSTHLMWQDFRRDGGPEAPIAELTAAVPTRWTVERRQTYHVAATNLGTRTWFTIRPAQTYLHIMFVGPDALERVDERVELWLPIPQDIAPNGRLEMDVSVMAPRKEGSYRLRHRIEIDPYFGLTPATVLEVPVVVRER
jgi:peptidoglycan/LPS O-acetylase OafA/YrhL